MPCGSTRPRGWSIRRPTSSTSGNQAMRSPEVTVGLMGLTGPSGVLPRYYSEVVTQTLRSRSTALRDFLDLLAHRFVAFFARGGIKYRPARAAEAAALRGARRRTRWRGCCWRSPAMARRI